MEVFLLYYEPEFSDIVKNEWGVCPESVMIFTDINRALFEHERIYKSGRRACIALPYKDASGQIVRGKILVKEPLDDYDRGLLDMKLNPHKYHKVI